LNFFGPQKSDLNWFLQLMTQLFEFQAHRIDPPAIELTNFPGFGLQISHQAIDPFNFLRPLFNLILPFVNVRDHLPLISLQVKLPQRDLIQQVQIILQEGFDHCTNAGLSFLDKIIRNFADSGFDIFHTVLDLLLHIEDLPFHKIEHVFFLIFMAKFC
jgi:hypothetical protein